MNDLFKHRFGITEVYLNWFFNFAVVVVVAHYCAPLLCLAISAFNTGAGIMGVPIGPV